MSLSVVWNNEQDEHEINGDLIELLERLLQTAGEAEGIDSGEVDLTFVNNERIHEPESRVPRH